ncbi:hypothetical protein E2562_037329, partial [Oryza meyeriana var. granulata]
RWRGAQPTVKEESGWSEVNRKRSRGMRMHRMASSDGEVEKRTVVADLDPEATAGAGDDDETEWRRGAPPVDGEGKPM